MFYINHVDIIDCECYNNTADRGGAIDLFIIGTAQVDNCIIENNTATSEGGGLYINTTSTPTEFRDSIIFEQDGKTIRQASNITNRIKELEKLNANKSTIDNSSKDFDDYSDDDDIEEPIVVKEKARWDKLDLKKLKPKEINDLIVYLKSIGKIK